MDGLLDAFLSHGAFFFCVVSIILGEESGTLKVNKHHLQSIVMILVVTNIAEREAQASHFIIPTFLYICIKTLYAYIYIYI